VLTDLLPRVDRLLDQRDGIRIEQGELIVPMDEGEDIPESVKVLAEQIGRRLRSTCPIYCWKSISGRALVTI
jgi:hypothetical protein